MIILIRCFKICLLCNLKEHKVEEILDTLILINNQSKLHKIIINLNIFHRLSIITYKKSK